MAASLVLGGWYTHPEYLVRSPVTTIEPPLCYDMGS
jgi:hypothetical protein